MPAALRRVTQRDITLVAGVSQATVSSVLNNRADADVRIAPETRERVLQAIADTGYVADSVARRLASRFDAYGGPMWNVQLAAASMTALPVLVVFVVAQKQFVEGLAHTGLKG
ncbi:regulatory protein, lacI family [Micromonospora pallida]|uniref:Regulatory protein, lacI family n=1 Tax=Micromonospora pallida TaxID=145854 RepID=A0A1C6T0L9_9ACTN|nr:LacI family DNA-binding transcriptional regulator [Micromonospora pallida]SCL34895.1 regulatory protein, lacI family [Micromonospora pallida]